MTKAELVAQLAHFKDDDEVVIWEWNGIKSVFWFAEFTCQNKPNEYNTMEGGKHFLALTPSRCRLPIK
jgi:hypothetical protein